jgi:hypothetical protein
MKEFIQAIIDGAKETPWLFFAPLTGAWKGVRHEYRVIERERRQRQKDQQLAAMYMDDGPLTAEEIEWVQSEANKHLRTAPKTWKKTLF